MTHRLPFSLLAAALFTLAITGQPAPRKTAQLENGHGAYATHRYRNLFAEAGHSQAEIDAKIDAAFQQLFHGDPQTQSVVFPAGSNANGPCWGARFCC